MKIEIVEQSSVQIKQGRSQYSEISRAIESAATGGQSVKVTCADEGELRKMIQGVRYRFRGRTLKSHFDRATCSVYLTLLDAKQERPVAATFIQAVSHERDTERIA